MCQGLHKLAREETVRDKHLYFLNIEIPLRFLTGTSKTLRILDRTKPLYDDLEARFGDTYQTVGEFYAAFRREIKLVHLLEVVPGIDAFVHIFEE